MLTLKAIDLLKMMRQHIDTFGARKCIASDLRWKRFQYLLWESLHWEPPHLQKGLGGLRASEMEFPSIEKGSPGREDHVNLFESSYGTGKRLQRATGPSLQSDLPRDWS
jgi:hypothetical protein